MYVSRLLATYSLSNQIGPSLNLLLRLNLNNQKDTKYDLRFHLYPGISAVQTLGGNSILIQVSKNISVIFSSKSQQLSIEKSIFLGSNKILNNLCITISGDLNNNDKIINWEIKKNIN